MEMPSVQKEFFTQSRKVSNRNSCFLEFAKGEFVVFFTNGKNRIEQPADPSATSTFAFWSRFKRSA